MNNQGLDRAREDKNTENKNPQKQLQVISCDRTLPTGTDLGQTVHNVRPLTSERTEHFNILTSRRGRTTRDQSVQSKNFSWAAQGWTIGE